MDCTLRLPGYPLPLAPRDEKPARSALRRQPRIAR